jgi:hypothetical protein
MRVSVLRVFVCTCTCTCMLLAYTRVCELSGALDSSLMYITIRYLRARHAAGKLKPREIQHSGIERPNLQLQYMYFRKSPINKKEFNTSSSKMLCQLVVVETINLRKKFKIFC